MSVFNKRREFVRFILVGILATATHYGIYFFLCVLMLPAIAYTIGYVISFILNFYLSNIFTFNTKPTVRKGIGFGISHFINYLLHIGAVVAIYMDRSSREMGTSSCVCISSAG